MHEHKHACQVVSASTYTCRKADRWAHCDGKVPVILSPTDNDLWEYGNEVTLESQYESRERQSAARVDNNEIHTTTHACRRSELTDMSMRRGSPIERGWYLYCQATPPTSCEQKNMCKQA
jgi:hypothetical protein